MKRIKGKWTGEERVVNGAGVLTPGPVELPEHLATEFQKQGLFKPEKVKEPEHVRSND